MLGSGVESHQRFTGTRDAGDKANGFVAFVFRFANDGGNRVGRDAKIRSRGIVSGYFAYRVATIQGQGSFDDGRCRTVATTFPLDRVNGWLVRCNASTPSITVGSDAGLQRMG